MGHARAIPSSHVRPRSDFLFASFISSGTKISFRKRVRVTRIYARANPCELLGPRILDPLLLATTVVIGLRPSPVLLLFVGPRLVASINSFPATTPLKPVKLSLEELAYGLSLVCING